MGKPLSPCDLSFLKRGDATSIQTQTARVHVVSLALLRRARCRSGFGSSHALL
jgi:hypothetical protein